jgi:hypothetical protein
MTRTMQGKIHGRTVELEGDPGLADGQRVEITIKTVPAKQVWGEGLRRCAGALADEWTDEDDRILEQIYLDRKRDTRKDISQSTRPVNRFRSPRPQSHVGDTQHRGLPERPRPPAR